MSWLAGLFDDTRKGEAGHLLSAGEELCDKGEVREALELWERALHLFAAGGNRRGEMETLCNLGGANLLLGNYPRAEKVLLRGVKLAQALQDSKIAARALGNLAGVYMAMGDPEQALRRNLEALATARRIGDDYSIAQALANVGYISYTQGKYREAIDHLVSSLEPARRSHDPSVESAALSSLGLVHQTMGDLGQAIQRLREALALARQAGNPVSEARALAQVAAVHHAVGEFDTAIEHYEQGLRIIEQHGIRTALPAFLSDLGVSYLAALRFERAEACFQRAWDLASDGGDGRLKGQALSNLAKLRMVHRDFSGAAALFLEASGWKRAAGDLRGVAYSYGQVGLCYQALGQLDQAIEQHRLSAQVAAEIGDALAQGTALTNLGTAHFQLGHHGDAQTVLWEAVALWESMRGRLGTEDSLRVSLLDDQLHTYAVLLRSLLADDQVEQALEVAERAKARALVDLLTRRLGAPDAAIGPSPTAQEIRELAARERATLVEYFLLSPLRDAAGHVLLETELLTWVVTPAGLIQPFRAALPRQGPDDRDNPLAPVLPSDGTGGSARDLVLAGAPRCADEDLRQLHALLIEPIADYLPRTPEDHVVVVPHHGLFLVPFAALLDREDIFLVDRHAISVATSIQVLLLTRERGRTAGRGALVVGDPEMPELAVSSDRPPARIPSLPFARHEAEAVAALLGTSPLLGADATKRAVLSRVKGKRFLHFATHGLLGTASSNLMGALVFAASGGDDGLLRVSEILQLDLRAELAVLSACNTGQGRATGDGVIGLSRALVCAGVASVVVSLWPVEDESTAFLMTEFYRNLQQLGDKANALRRAMLATRVRHPNPSDWAAFLLVGESI
jgi:CHAT domain-containing protein/tetratricopeptide (TPR) repeat protein